MIARPLSRGLSRPLLRSLINTGSFGPGELLPTLDWYPALGSFASVKGPTPAFSRASGATMIDVDGNVVWGPENLLRASGDFSDSSWEKGETTILSNATTAPDGTLTADKIIPSVTLGNHSASQPITSTNSIQTTSVYVKAAGYNFAYVALIEGGGMGAVVNLLDGTVTSILGAVTPTTENSGNGWWKVSITGQNGAGYSKPGVYPSIDGVLSPFSGNGSSGVYAWGAQLERSSTARAYIPTTSAPVYGPRITYDPVTHECLGYLAEEQRMNIITRSNDFSDAVWSKTFGVTLTPGQSGGSGNDAWRFTSGAGVATYEFFQAFSGTSGLSYTWSVYAKAGTASHLILMAFDGSGANRTWFNLTAGTVGTNAVGNTAMMIPCGNGWYRCSITRVASGTAYYHDIAISSSDNVLTTSLNSYMDFYGAQVEQGSFPTSYIPTTSAAATRSADVCQIGGADFTGMYNQSEGTVVLDGAMPQANGYMWQLFDGSNGTRMVSYNSGGDNLDLYTDFPPTVVLNLGSFSGVARVKTATGIITGNLGVTVNGGAVTASGAFVNPSTVTHLMLGSWTGSNHVNGTIARIQYFNTRLPDAKLIELTQP